jgi:Mn2+/Fe2+ NRAMP family transporter
MTLARSAPIPRPGQNYGTTLLWTLMLLIPVLYVNQEMVLRLGAVSGVGHARLILERYGKFWGAFSVIDLFLLNALTIVTEFIGISLALDYFGLPKNLGVLASAFLMMGAVSTGNFWRFERFAVFLAFGSLLLVSVIIMCIRRSANWCTTSQCPACRKEGI